MVDTLVLEASLRVRVRVPPGAPRIIMEEDIDFFEFAELMQKYEQALDGVEFALEQKEGEHEGEEVWQLDIDGQTMFFPTFDEVKVYLDKLVVERN